MTLILSKIVAMNTQQALLLSLAIIVLTITVMNMRRRRPKDASPRQYRREIDAATSQNAAVKRDMEVLLVELEELSRKINAQIDTKFAKLEQSIADADRRVTALRILIEETKRLHGKKPEEGEASEPAGPNAAARSDAREPEQSMTLDAEEQSAQPSPHDRRQRIYALADAGRSPVEIARELGTQPGEVELILNLRSDPGR